MLKKWSATYPPPLLPYTHLFSLTTVSSVSLVEITWTLMGRSV